MQTFGKIAAFIFVTSLLLSFFGWSVLGLVAPWWLLASML